MAVRTAIQVRNAVLEHLNIKAQGDSAVAEDAQKVDDLYTSEYPGLVKRGLALWSKSTVPDWAWEGLTLHLAGLAAPKFGFSGQRRAETESDGRKGLRMLQEQSMGLDHGTTPVEYF